MNFTQSYHDIVHVHMLVKFNNEPALLRAPVSFRHLPGRAGVESQLLSCTPASRVRTLIRNVTVTAVEPERSASEFPARAASPPVYMGPALLSEVSGSEFYFGSTESCLLDNIIFVFRFLKFEQRQV